MLGFLMIVGLAGFIFFSFLFLIWIEREMNLLHSLVILDFCLGSMNVLNV